MIVRIWFLVPGIKLQNRIDRIHSTVCWMHSLTDSHIECVLWKHNRTKEIVHSRLSAFCAATYWNSIYLNGIEDEVVLPMHVYKYEKSTSFKLPHVVCLLLVFDATRLVSLSLHQMNWSTRIDRRWTATTTTTSENVCTTDARGTAVCALSGVCWGSSWTFISRKFIQRWRCSNKRSCTTKQRFGNLISSLLSVVASTGHRHKHSCVCVCCNRSDML